MKSHLSEIMCQYMEILSCMLPTRAVDVLWNPWKTVALFYISTAELGKDWGSLCCDCASAPQAWGTEGRTQAQPRAYLS